MLPQSPQSRNFSGLLNLIFELEEIEKVKKLLKPLRGQPLDSLVYFLLDSLSHVYFSPTVPDVFIDNHSRKIFHLEVQIALSKPICWEERFSYLSEVARMARPECV
jgi:hypothetical protein